LQIHPREGTQKTRFLAAAAPLAFAPVLVAQTSSQDTLKVERYTTRQEK
jgi:hypothetical protein